MNGVKIKSAIIAVNVLIAGLFNDCTYTPSSDTFGFEQTLKNTIIEKVERAGYYTMASKQAEKEGYGELSVYFSEVAEEEINHVKALSVLNRKTERTTKKNVLKTMKMEKNASRRDYQSIISKAGQLGEEEIVKVFEQIVQDEERHYLGLRGFVKKKRVK